MKLIDKNKIELNEKDVLDFWGFFRELEHSGIDLNHLFHTDNLIVDNMQISQNSIIAILRLSELISLVDFDRRNEK